MSFPPKFIQQVINFTRTKRNKGGSQLRCNKVQTAVINQSQALPANNDANDTNDAGQFFNIFSPHYSSSTTATVETIESTNDEKRSQQPSVKKRRMIRKPKKSKNIPSKENEMLMFPPEIFVNICKFLPPNDLISLSRVCKLYYNYLCSDDIQCTQNIWKTSREIHLEKLQLPPPEGMNERQYCKLFVERGCQICKKPKIRKVYWAFRVRCCKECLMKHTKSLYRITDELRISPMVLYGLAYVTHVFWTRRNGEFPVKFYWLSKVKEMDKEYKALPPSERNRWVNAMIIKGRKEMDEINMRP
jgi:hypothetical protein